MSNNLKPDGYSLTKKEKWQEKESTVLFEDLPDWLGVAENSSDVDNISYQPLFSVKTIQQEIDRQINVLERMIKDVENGRDGINETAVRAKREALKELKNEFSGDFTGKDGENNGE